MCSATVLSILSAASPSRTRPISVFANSLRGEVLRTEDQMDLRNELAPQTILAKNPNKVDDLGVGQVAVVQ